MALCKRILLICLVPALLALADRSATAAELLRIMPLGDSNTRGTYPTDYAGPNPVSIGAGGYRYPLQQMLAVGGYRYQFVGSQTSNAVGDSGLGQNPSSTWCYDPAFQRYHQGCAGFTNAGLITGGNVPTCDGDPVIYAPSLVNCLGSYRPDIVLLMSGTNGMGSLGAAANLQDLDRVIRTITTTSPTTHVIVSTIFDRWNSWGRDATTQSYNAGIPDLVTAAQLRGGLVTFVDCASVLDRDDFLFNGILRDGVHPNPVVAEPKVAAVWYAGIRAIAPVPEPSSLVLVGIGSLLLARYCSRKQILGQ
jgi:hypothetical protein